jgi:class 3 adenylate cyclase
VLPRGNRTFICSVVFIDIIEYSRKAVAEQIRLKEQLNSLLAEALKDVAANDRVILDTGDGAAISFVGDPEDALFVCIALRDGVITPPAGVAVPLQMRIGINLGPVKLVQDLNGQPNIIGDGINVAQRIMGFAEPNQILVARSYYEVVSCLSDAYGKLFHYEGSRTDKHVREHEVYAVGDSTLELKLKYEADRPAPARPTGTSTSGKTVIDHLTHFPSRMTENLRTRPRLGTALAVVAILVFAVALRGMRERPPAPVPPREAVRPIAAAPASAVPEAPEPPFAPGPANAKTRERTSAEVAARPLSPVPAEKPTSAPARTTAAPPPVRAKPRTPATGTSEPTVVPPPVAVLEPDPLAAGGAGIVSFAIAPWGEIYVDGQKRGVSPPMRELELNPGSYKIEIRNTTFPTHVRTVEVEAGGRIRIKHQFR